MASHPFNPIRTGIQRTYNKQWLLTHSIPPEREWEFEEARYEAVKQEHLLQWQWNACLTSKLPHQGF